MVRTILRTYRAAFAGLPRDVWLLAFIALVNRSGSMVLPFFSLFLTRDRGLSVVQAGTVLSLYGLGAIAGSYVGGRLTDAIGPVRAQQASLILTGLGFVWITTLESATALTVAVLPVSIAAEAFRPANMAAFAQHAPPGVQVRAFALLRLAANLGMGVGPAVGGVLALVSYSLLFVVDAVTCWIAAGLLSLFLSAPRVVHHEPPAGARTGTPWRDGPFLLLMLLTVFLAMVFFQVFSTLPLYLRDAYGLREDAIGLLLAFNAVLIVAFEMVLIHWAERRSRLWLIGIGSFLVCLGFALMPLGASPAYAALTIVVWTVGEMLALPLLTAVTAERSGPANRGRYMGLYTMAFSIAFVFAPALGTWIYGTYGPDILWYAVGMVGPPLLFGALLLARSFSPDSRPPTSR